MIISFCKLICRFLGEFIFHVCVGAGAPDRNLGGKNLCLRCFTSHDCEYQKDDPLPINDNDTTNKSSSSTFLKLDEVPSRQLNTNDSLQSFNYHSKPTLPTHNPASVKPNITIKSHTSTTTSNNLANNSTSKKSTNSVCPTYQKDIVSYSHSYISPLRSSTFPSMNYQNHSN